MSGVNGGGVAKEGRRGESYVKHGDVVLCHFEYN
jgi:hypothetical protein